MTSSAPASSATTRSKTLGWGEESSWRRSLRTRRAGIRAQAAGARAVSGLRPAGAWGLTLGAFLSLDAYPVLPFGVARERVLGGARPGDHFIDARLIGERALERFL